jgi:hypothetical protein
MSTAVLQRGKRKTAGRRMTALVGEAQEEDDTFWGHNTWAEDDSGNESFHDSDEDSTLKKDQFDSDFDDSESDNEDAEQAAGEEEERQLQRQERSSKRGNQYVDGIGGRKRAKGKRRIMGDGINAGIVLNFPSQMMTSAITAAAVQPTMPQPPTAITSAIMLRRKSRKSPDAAISLASTRERRSQKRLRETRSTARAPLQKSKRTTSKKAKRRLFKQEELLIEAVNETEPGNQRWLLARKRVKDSVEQDRDLSLRDKTRGKIIQKYHSRRGCLITLTFPEMDSVPSILTTRSLPPKQPQKQTCVITGKSAKYRDPQTNLGYYDLTAFKELRRRAAAKEPLDQRAKPIEATTRTTKTSKSVKSPSQATAIDNYISPVATAPQTPMSNAKTIIRSAAAALTLTALTSTVEASPSGRRLSPRQWKPSERLLQNIVHKQHVVIASKVIPPPLIASSNRPTTQQAQIHPPNTEAIKTAEPTRKVPATKKPRKAPAKSKHAQAQKKAKATISSSEVVPTKAKKPATKQEPTTKGTTKGASTQTASKAKQATAPKTTAIAVARKVPNKEKEIPPTSQKKPAVTTAKIDSAPVTNVKESKEMTTPKESTVTKATSKGKGTATLKPKTAKTSNEVAGKRKQASKVVTAVTTTATTKTKDGNSGGSPKQAKTENGIKKTAPTSSKEATTAAKIVKASAKKPPAKKAPVTTVSLPNRTRVILKVPAKNPPAKKAPVTTVSLANGARAIRNAPDKKPPAKKAPGTTKSPANRTRATGVANHSMNKITSPPLASSMGHPLVPPLAAARAVPPYHHLYPSVYHQQQAAAAAAYHRHAAAIMAAAAASRGAPLYHAAAAAAALPGFSRQPQREQVYAVPREGVESNGTPLLITQSQLIMQAISNFKKQKAQQPPQSQQKK